MSSGASTELYVSLSRVKSIGPDHEIATRMRAPFVSAPRPSVASSPARCAPAEAPKAPMRVRVDAERRHLGRLAQPADRGAHVVDRGGVRMCGCEAVVDREHDETEPRELACVVDELGSVAEPPPSTVDEHDGGTLLAAVTGRNASRRIGSPSTVVYDEVVPLDD